MISVFRVPSFPAAASFWLKRSSLIPAQLSASARTPVTFPTFAVSLADSISPSMGRASSEVPETPAAIRVHLVTSASLLLSFASSWLASVAVSVSPRIL